MNRTSLSQFCIVLTIHVLGLFHQEVQAGTTTTKAAVINDWVDPDTPTEARFSSSLSPDDARTYALVFSDEFDVNGRTFRDGQDPRWTAVNKDDFTNNPLNYYSDDQVFSRDGHLVIKTEIEPKTWVILDNDGRNYANSSKEVKSGMIQGWNKFCFTGGIVEFDAKLPGKPDVAGLWPAVWLLGNLARATYVNSTEHLWPFSTNACNDATRTSQLINSCPDSPRSFPGMPQGRGRGVPEIDVFEIMIMEAFENPLLTASLQVAPGIPKNRPVIGQLPNASQNWYSDLIYENGTTLNSYFYGVTVQAGKMPGEKHRHNYQTDAITGNHFLTPSFHEKMHRYRIEWEPPFENSTGGYVRWYLDNVLFFGLSGDDLFEHSQTEVPSEPMYLIMNTAVSKDWGFPDAWFLNCKHKCWSCLDPKCQECALPKGYCDNLPAEFEFDFIRVYQAVDDPKQTLGCSPPKRPTKEFIESRLQNYDIDGGTTPLQPIQEGGGSCHSDKHCGHGLCPKSSKSCECNVNFTGPFCLAHSPGASIPLLEPHHFPYFTQLPRHRMTMCCIFGILGTLVAVIGWKHIKFMQKRTEYESIL